ncbi:TetR/AcrR family transcriptional regulator [Microbacterium arabinogalactanolyticum]|uniref:TetR/AcrR family transcriptional regulator n=1 Tax=Microbacterium arabinogalactanolyticum TaxID=69365 RepID=UPI0025551799|nr:TetR-like C-terminal domain-containing protein [Microbacterium arabinogalactanolyticum]GLC86099.1 TetR family transcriptional regulator [Microbacterium arabinogalactanolyticum]
MPAPLRVSQERLVHAIREIAERDGIDAVTMSSVASAVGMRTPSLYKRAAHRHDLLRLAAGDAVRELMTDISELPAHDSAGALTVLARTLRAYAARAPRVSALIFAAPSAQADPTPASAEPLLTALMTAIAAAVPGDPLPAARTFTAWIFGFCTMEQAGAFRLGGDVDEAFEFGLDALLGAIGARRG